MLRIALDAMGGDNAPKEILKGAFLALEAFDIHIELLGPKEKLKRALKSFPQWPHDRLSIVHAPEVVTMCESPTTSFRKKKESSIQVGLRRLKKKSVNAFVSAGNTGAVMTASTLILGRIKGVERPAIASRIPTPEGECVMLDMGSSVDCKPEHLAQFAVMGNHFADEVMGIHNPKVGLLNIGEEEDKGNQQVQQAYDLIKVLPLNFMGNVEGKDILKGKADVVVCDGFVGNNLLKFGEGVAGTFFRFFKTLATKNLRTKLGMLLLKPELLAFKNRFDHESVGGAPLLGVDGVSVIAHGSSSGMAIKNAISAAIRAVENNIVDNIAGDLRK